MIWIVSDEGEVITTLTCPLIQSSLYILSPADFEEYGFLIGVCKCADNV